MRTTIGIIAAGVIGIGIATARAADRPADAAHPAAQKRNQSAGPQLPLGVVFEKDVEYGRAGDRPLKLDVYRPAKQPDKPLPAIVFIHGGGWQNGDKAGGSGLRNYVQTGHYVGFSVGYRLSGEATWPAQIHDCKAAVRWVRANARTYGVDPDRIGVWGTSAGGHLVALLGTSGDVKELEGENGTPGVSSRVACVADYYGPADFTVFRHPAVLKLFGDKLDERMAEAKAGSPITHVSKDDPPFLIVHGTEDRTVPVSQSEAFGAALKKAGVDVTFVRVIGAGHSIRVPAARDRARLFFEKHLRGQDVEVSGEPIQETPARAK